MALTNFRFWCKQSNKFKVFLKSSCILTKEYSFSAKKYGVLKRKYFTVNNLLKYGTVIGAFSAFSLYTINSSIKTESSISASSNNESGSIRERFNFIAKVVEKSAEAVVLLENPVVFRLDDGVELPGVQGGSGFIIKEDGLILTNAHVVAQSEGSKIQVKLKDGKIFSGEILYVDYATDLATVKINAENLPVIKLGSSDDLKAGEWVVAMGSPLFLKDSVSVGIVSSVNRKGEEIGRNDMEFIQTDAAIAMGNSGGPLVNLDGEAVGVNTLGFISGISFAVPIKYVNEFLSVNEERRKKGEKSVGVKWFNYIGVSMQTISPEIFFQMRNGSPNKKIPEFLLHGVLITDVMPGSPAFKSGLKNGDVVLEVNGERIAGTAPFFKFLASQKFLNLKIFRNNDLLTVILAPQ